MSLTGQKVAIRSLDVRRPALLRFFGLPPGQGHVDDAADLDRSSSSFLHPVACARASFLFRAVPAPPRRQSVSPSSTDEPVSSRCALLDETPVRVVFSFSLPPCPRSLLLSQVQVGAVRAFGRLFFWALILSTLPPPGCGAFLRRKPKNSKIGRRCAGAASRAGLARRQERSRGERKLGSSN